MTTFPGGIFGDIAMPQIESRGPQYQNDATPKNPIGAKCRWNNTILRYVRHDKGSGSVVPNVGGPAWGKTITPAATATAVPVFTVTPTVADSVFGQTPVGVYIHLVTLTDQFYTWIQVGGIAQCVVPGSIEEDTIIGSNTNNQFGNITAGSAITRTQVGIRQEGASAAGLSPVLLMNMDW